jgi:hypothetical protein
MQKGEEDWIGLDWEINLKRHSILVDRGKRVVFRAECGIEGEVYRIEIFHYERAECWPIPGGK